MRVEKIGEGEPEYTVVGSIHGDEPCGRDAIERFLSEEWELDAAVKFIVANEEALDRGVRYIDNDLNRVFPGDPESDRHEERLAAEITREVVGTKVLDIHSTRSQDEPFGVVSDIEDETLSLLSSTGVSDVAYFPTESGTLNEQVPAVTVEAGRQGTDRAKEQAYTILVNFLAAEGVLDTSYERSEPEIYEYYDTVEGGDLEFTAENFSLVKRGEVFARGEEGEIRADEDFYPILMSNDGYKDILGYRGRKVEKGEGKEV